MKLHELRDNPGAVKKRMRVGRGPGSGKGKTGGRGMKGQSSRSGVALGGFEGGQMPLFRRLPKRGFTNPFRKRFTVVNLSTLQDALDRGKLQAGARVTEEALVESGVIRRKRDGVRVLGRGALNSALTLVVSGASASAQAALAAAGGGVELLNPAANAEAVAADTDTDTTKTS